MGNRPHADERGKFLTRAAASDYFPSLETFFVPAAQTDTAKKARWKELDAALEGAFILGDISLALACYNDYQASSHVRFPFDGGRLEQPEWVLHNLNVLTLWSEWFELRRELGLGKDGEEDEWDSDPA